MTVKEKQCLLYFLGYYVGNIDGEWGQLSRTATKMFQKDFGLDPDGICGPDTEQAMKHAVCYGMPVKTTDKAVSGDFWGKVKYFNKAEFACECGCGADTMEEKLILEAEDVREHFGSPVNVTSGRRCAKHNARVGGVSNSRHLIGKAMDFSVRGKTSAEVLFYVQKKKNIRYAYAIDGSHVHMDIE